MHLIGYQKENVLIRCRKTNYIMLHRVRHY